MRLLSRVLGTAAIAIALTSSGVAAAAGDAATAEHLFQQGLEAMKTNHFKEACDAFLGSNEADRSVGTEINLGLCNEKQGKLATAWGWYRTAAGYAEQSRLKDRADLARAEAAKIEPKLHKLVISVKFPSEGLVVTRNGTAVPSATLNTDVPIDPGEYLIEVNAKGKKAYKQTVRIAAAPGVDRVEIPALEDAPADAVVPPGGDARPAGSDGSTQRTIGFVVGGAGILALVAAGGIVIFNLAVTNSEYKDVKKDFEKGDCAAKPEGTNCPQLLKALESKDEARDANTVAAIAVGATGAAMVIGGIILLVTAPNGKTTGTLSKPLILPSVTQTSAGLGLSASF